MKKFVVVTAFGKDQPGMVAGVSEALYALGGNLEDASMTRLGGEFAMMMVVALPSKVTLPAASKALAPWGRRLGLQFQIKPIQPALARRRADQGAAFLISVYGTDRAGIVSNVTRALADRKISITGLNTRVLRHAKKAIYILLLEIQVPPKADMDSLRSELDQMRQALGVEITLQDIEPVAL